MHNNLDENDDISVNESYSGYYLFDSLWTKINGVWNYFLVLFDVKLNSVVSMDLVESEDIGTIYKFLDDSLRNQPKICIVSDLKDEYHPVIEKIGVIHQFCMFHTKTLVFIDNGSVSNLIFLFLMKSQIILVLIKSSLLIR